MNTFKTTNGLGLALHVGNWFKLAKELLNYVVVPRGSTGQQVYIA